jgi:RNA-directed DNA polymerase
VRASRSVLRAAGGETPRPTLPYGFRPGRGQQDALDALDVGIFRRRVNWVLDADIRGFFDAMAHSWIIRFLKRRIADKRILRVIAKWLKVGIVEDGRRTRGVCGAPQGAVITLAFTHKSEPLKNIFS